LLKVFVVVVQIFRHAKDIGIINYSMFINLAEDETNVKGCVAWEAKYGTLAGFYGPKSIHICILGL